MLNKLRTYLKEGFTYTGLEISESDGKEKYVLLELKQRKNELVIGNKKELADLKDLPSSIKKRSPLFLSINTAAVLTKQLEGVGTTNPEAMVNQAFPNLDFKNFYFEVIQAKTSPIVSISKKEHVDTFIKRLKELKINLLGFSLGISALETVSDYLKNNVVKTAKHELEFNEEDITRISPLAQDDGFQESELNINGLNLSNKYLLPFAQILGHLGQKPSISNFEVQLEDLKWEFKNHRIFDQVLKYALAFFIILLLSNFFVYNSYHEKVGELNAAMAATSSRKEELAQLDASVQRKQERVETLTTSANSKATYYLDLLAQTIPTSVLLNEIKFQPLAKPVREQKPIILENETILVSGISKDVNDFSFWVEELEKLGWITSVETLDYDYISKNTSNFLLEIGFDAD